MSAGAGAGAGVQEQGAGAGAAQCARAIGASTMLVAVHSAVEQALQRVHLVDNSFLRVSLFYSSIPSCTCKR